MKLNPLQLNSHLSKGLAPIYLVFGDEPLQVRESLDAIRACARTNHYDERMVFEVESGFDWNALRAETESMSLFAANRLLEVRIPSGKPGTDGAKFIKGYVERPAEGVVLLLSAGKLEQSALRSAWYKSLESQGVVIRAWPVKPEELPGWIVRRAKENGLNITQPAARLLAQRVEGNQLACAQEVEKLRLLFEGKEVDEKQVLEAVFDNARYTVYELVDSAMSGQGARAVHILNTLRMEGIAPPIVVWALGEQLRPLTLMAREIRGGGAIERVMASHRVWDSRKRAVRHALQKNSEGRLLALLRRLGRVDRIIKGQLRGNPWDELARMSLFLSGIKI